MPREYGLDPYGIVARGNSMYGGSGSTSPFGSIAPTFRGGMPGIKFRTAFAEGGYADGGMATSLPFMGSTPPPPQRGNPYGGMDKDQRKSLNEMRRNYGINQPTPTQPGFPSMLPRDPGYGMPTSLTPKTGIGSLLQQSDLYQSLFGNGTAAPAPAPNNGVLTPMQEYLGSFGSNTNFAYDPATQTYTQSFVNNAYGSPDYGQVAYGQPISQADMQARADAYAQNMQSPQTAMPLSAMGGASPYTIGQPAGQMGGSAPYPIMAGGGPDVITANAGMGGPRPYQTEPNQYASPYTIGQPAGQIGGMPQSPMPTPPMQPMTSPQDQRQMMRDQRQDQRQMQQPMQGGQMMNRPFAVRGR